MLFLDELAQEKDIKEVPLRLVEVWMRFCNLKVQNLVLKIDLVNRRCSVQWVVYSRAYGSFFWYLFAPELVKLFKSLRVFKLIAYFFEEFDRQPFKNGGERASLYIYGVRSIFNLVSVWQICTFAYP